MDAHSRSFPGWRAALLSGTALFLPGITQAQPSNAQPQGGRVVAGTATIQQGASRTTITQSTHRAAIDWRSFDIGRDQSVQFQQPSTGSVTLNRVTGPDPSAIAGRIQANGQVAIVNQSGVVFHRGAQVDAAGLLVSTANIANGAFMRGGRMVFDQPGRADARIENHGEITVREAGLAALVAPQVANRGSITARLGRVVLAGAQTHAVDLHGDGLLSLEVLSPVRQRPANGEALVTNTGAITAEGGTIHLTAAAVDGIVQDLVRAGGRITADTDAASGRAGRVVIAGTGGTVRIEGSVSAQGRAAGTRGGTIEVVGDRSWIAPGAEVDASGRAGGGGIAVGTAPGRLSRRTGVAQGAVLRADATERGAGGRVIVNSSEYTAHAGEISASGGPQGGDGGFVEVSGQRGLSVTGTVRVNAGLGGTAGTFLIDPVNLTIVAGVGGSDGDAADGVLGTGEGPANATIGTTFINGFAANLRLEATSTITIDAAVNKPAGGLELVAGTNIVLNAPITLGAGNLLLQLGGSLAVTQPLQVSAANRVTLTAGSITQSGAGRVVGGSLLIPSGFDVTLGGDNQIATLEGIGASANILFRNLGSLRVTGQVGGITDNSRVVLTVVGGDLNVASTLTADLALIGAQFGGSGMVLRASGNIVVEAGGSVLGLRPFLSAGYDEVAGAVNPAAAGGIQLAGLVRGSLASTDPITTGVDLRAGTSGIVQTAGAVGGTTLNLQSGGNALLNASSTNNLVDTLGASDVAGNLSLASLRTGSAGFDLSLAGAIRAGGTLTLTVPSGARSIVQAPGSVLTASRLVVSVPINGATLGGENRIVELGDVDVEAPFFLRNATALRVTGLVSVNNALARLEVVGDLDITGTIRAHSGVDLRASGNINLAAGSVVRRENLSGGGGGIITLLAGYDFSLGATNPASPAAISLAGTLGDATDITPITLATGTGGIRQSGGRIIGTVLNVRSGGDAVLDSGNNALTTLSGVSLPGTFVLDNGVSPLLITGGITAGNFGIRTAGAVSVLTAVAAAGRASFRVGSLAVGPSVGSVAAPLIEIAPFAANPVALPDPGAGGTTFRLSSALLGALTADTLRVGATTFDGAPGTSATAITFPNSFAFAGTLDLRATGDITQAANRTLTAGRLTGAAGGAITLLDAGNTLPVIGDLSAGGALSLRTTGGQSLTGAVLAPSVALTMGGDLVQTGAGRIGGGSLTLQVPGGASLLGANTISALAGAAGGDLRLANTSTQLTVPAGNLVSAGGLLSLAQIGALVVDGTVSGARTVLTASGRLQVNGNSAIARSGDLLLAGDIVGLDGLAQAAGEIRVDATSSATLGGRAVAPRLRITSPAVDFTGLDAAAAGVLLFLGAAGTASGTLNAASLAVYGGAGAALSGRIAGVSGEPAAILGLRGTAGGTLLAEPLPRQNAFLFNNCPIGAAICRPVLITPPVVMPPVVMPPSVTPPLVTPPLPTPATVITPTNSARPPATVRLVGLVTLADNPLPVVAVLSPGPNPPAREALQPPRTNLAIRPARDRSEEEDLAAPNVRGEDF